MTIPRNVALAKFAFFAMSEKPVAINAAITPPTM